MLCVPSLNAAYVYIQVLYDWIMNIASNLVSMEVDSAFLSGRRMCSVLALLYILHMHMLNQDLLDPGDISMLFSMLYLRPNIEQLKCEDLWLLQSAIPARDHVRIAHVLVYFTNFVLPHRIICKDCQWVHVIPLIHILKGKVQPFTSLYGKEIKWMDDDVKLAVVRQNSSVPASRYSLCIYNHGIAIEPSCSCLWSIW